MVDETSSRFPAGLLSWAGHRSGGVRRLFYEQSGRPSGEVVRTGLLERLEGWATRIASSAPNTPRAVFLVGGPGNGKTEAVEHTLGALDAAFGMEGSLIAALKAQFVGTGGRPPPRLARQDLSGISGSSKNHMLSVVQDASVNDEQQPGMTPATLLVEDLRYVLTSDLPVVYLACVNRGILDDALIAASGDSGGAVRSAIEDIVRSVGTGPDARECWPLEGHPGIAVWPMDAESLLERTTRDPAHTESAAAQVLSRAIDPARWPTFGACPAGIRCPHCISRKLLSEPEAAQSLLRTLRWYELASGKRWTFRDLFSLVSFLLAGTIPHESAGNNFDPCAWAAGLELLPPSGRRGSIRLSAPFMLVAAQYQHALFGYWPRVGLRAFKKDLAELGLGEEPTLSGLYHFLGANRAASVPATLSAQLANMTALLDPAVADPDLEVELSSRTKIQYRDIDMRFSQGVGEGYTFIQKYRCLSTLETELLKKLGDADQLVSQSDASVRHSATCARVQAVIRNFSCRLVRRSLGVSNAVMRDAPTLSDFQALVGGDVALLHDVAKQVEALLNEREKFVVTLNTTFGEPLPPLGRRAVLTTAKQRVRPQETRAGDRPLPAVRFLSVGTGRGAQSIPLTYELFKSVRELRKGMMPASLPRAVVALLDTTRAKLSGRIVRDEEALDGAEMRVGAKADVIVRELGKFLVRTEDAT